MYSLDCIWCFIECQKQCITFLINTPPRPKLFSLLQKRIKENKIAPQVLCIKKKTPTTNLTNKKTPLPTTKRPKPTQKKTNKPKILGDLLVSYLLYNRVVMKISCDSTYLNWRHISLWFDQSCTIKLVL